MTSFNNLSNKDKEEYLKLYNRFDKSPTILKMLPNELFTGMNPEEIQVYSQKLLDVAGIYKTNGFDDGIGISASR